MRVYGEPKSRTTPRRIQLVSKVPRPGRTCLYHGEAVSAKHALGISLSVAVVPDAYGRVGVAAALALQGYVAEERFTSGALPAQQ